MQISSINPFFAYSGPAVPKTASGNETKASVSSAAADVAPVGSTQGASVADQQQLALSLLQAQATSYDQPSSKNLRAVDVYQDIDSTPQREQLSSMLGIDLYA
ncbi:MULTISPECIES: hypothetical protein [Corallincola]|uniref:Anti-sigma-28 factor FlgM C-terminal domain-containing protein n=2 Tax=Corallincola TaxID=1775176 RepID=A0ABY1WV49_9GAMM|nr:MULTISPECIES: hypothetical protein [Corallincola]TAA48613.1 hypothetical protein EXY25_05175 [Corallincola spongiicola]TCI05528.1 hypothetical protein EZV61_06235 [Corallincola luteus]